MVIKIIYGEYGCTHRRAVPSVKFVGAGDAAASGSWVLA